MKRRNSRSKYKVTYSGTRHYDTYSTKREALDQARYATKVGNSKSCVSVKLPSGRWQQVKCVMRHRRF